MQKETKNENTYISSIKSLMYKEVSVAYDNLIVKGILVGANFNPLNIVLKIDGKIMIIKGPTAVREL